MGHSEMATLHLKLEMVGLAFLSNLAEILQTVPHFFTRKSADL